MKILIVRLNGNILTQYSLKQFIQQQQKESSVLTSSSSISSSSDRSDLDNKEQEKQKKEEEEKQLEIEQYNKRTIILEIIDHSRKLSLLQYDNELNYVRIRGEEYFYLARHKLLFIYNSTQKHHTIQAIQNILRNCVLIYEQKFQNICKGKKLPNYLTDYQTGQFQKLSFKIHQIITEEEHFQLKRKQSFRESDSTQIMPDIAQRSQAFRSISEKQLKRKEQSLKYLYQTEKKLNYYRFKSCLLFLIAVVVSGSGCYLIFFRKSTEY